MSLTSETMTPADIAAVTGNNNNGMWGDGAWWIIILLLFGWGRNGSGWGGNGGGAADNYVLASDFATIQRQLSDGFNSIDNALDRQNAGICDLGYTQLNLTNGINMNMMQGFNALGTQLADCCCTTQQNIKENTTQGIMNTAAIQNQIQQCCCDAQKDTMQTRFDMAQYNCQTQQAIDKVGDRIIDYLANEKAQALRDENHALRLAASQQAQNAYLVNTLRPAPVPAFTVPAPFQYSGCGCGCSC